MKKASVMNFNLIYYGKDEEKPLLSHFDNIFMPALASNIIRQTKDSKYFFMNVEVNQDNEGEYVLTGLLVKKTVLEVKSDIDENGKLVEKDDRYPTAPYSMFVIYLKNHRMLYVENQKGSPDIRSFKATIKYVVNRYVCNMNKELEEKGEEELPIPIINVTGIPVRSKIDEALKDVVKINQLILRFYPLNGDIDYLVLLDGISEDLRKKVGCKHGEIILKSPENISGVIEVVSQSDGTVEPIFNVTYFDKRKGKIRNEEISEKLEIDIVGDTLEEKKTTIEKGKKIKAITYTSENNKKIYDEYQAKIIPFVKR